MRRSAATMVLSGAVAAVLLGVRPHPVALGRRLVAPEAWLRESGPDAALADLSASLLWCVAAWLGAGIVVTLLAAVPGSAGQLFAAASRRLVPATLRRLVAGSAGLGVLLAPVPAAVTTGALPTHQVVAAITVPPPVWPGTPTPAGHPNPPPAAERPVQVRAGDSLWLITARRLGPGAAPADIAATWPRWYAANRTVIGDDPDLILPGQLLSPPRSSRPSGART